jgi:exopolysaccharide production protein ExoY
MRRIFDIAVVLVMLVVTFPLLALAALAVLISSGRPVFFGHRRIGRNGVPFCCWKLRTMAVDAERTLHASEDLHSHYVSNGFKLPLAADPRVTPLGRWLRRSYIDELPQLFNVLNGTMALVGPRPIVEAELAYYGDHALVLLAERPGIFGAWAAGGRQRAAYPERVQIELAYVRARSFGTDLSILARSVPVVLLGQSPDA